LDVEVFSAQTLARTQDAAREAYQRTHVTAYIYENPDRFRIASLTAEKDYSKYRWTLDTVEDLEAIREIYKRFQNGNDMRWHEVLSLMERHPEIAELNSHVRQKMLREG
jgi:spore coat polysaccharide biosynthesis protein SpsF